MILRTTRTSLCLFTLLLLAVARPVHAQSSEHTMSEAEVERLREAAYVPADRVAEFIKILNARAKSIDSLITGRRRPGREQQIHDLMDQFGGITDEFTDNLDDYGHKHRDLRKALPKLLEATERWSTTLRAPVDDPAYNVVRKVALDAVRDLHDAAAAMNTDQIAYFKAHPEAVKADQARTHPDEQKPIDIPR